MATPAVTPRFTLAEYFELEDAYDRRTKLEAYQLIPALVEVVFVAHDARRLEVSQRAPDGTWCTVTAGAGEAITLALGATLAVDDVYFDPTEPPGA